MLSDVCEKVNTNIEIIKQSNVMIFDPTSVPLFEVEKRLS